MAYVCADPGVPVFGWKGCSIHVQEVIRALIRKGAEVELHAARLGGSPPPDMRRLATFQLPRYRGGDPSARELACIAANDRLAVALRHRPAYDAVYERHSLWSTAGMDLAGSLGIPGILEVNAPLIEEQAIHRRLIHHELAEEAVHRALGAATLVIAVSKGVANHLRRFEAARGRVHVIPNGVDPQRFFARRDPAAPRPSGTFTVGFVGGLRPWHDLPTLVRAFDGLYRRHDETRLLVVGDGPERGNLTRELEERGLLASTRFTGAIAPADVPGWMERMDVGVAPYPAMGDCYFSPLKLFEYMAAGLPIVASRVGQASEVIEHEENGLLCGPGDPESLAEALDRLRANPDLRTRLGRSARARALQRHTWDAVVASVLDCAGLGSRAPAHAEVG